MPGADVDAMEAELLRLAEGSSAAFVEEASPEMEPSGSAEPAVKVRIAYAAGGRFGTLFVEIDGTTVHLDNNADPMNA